MAMSEQDKRTQMINDVRRRYPLSSLGNAALEPIVGLVIPGDMMDYIIETDDGLKMHGRVLRAMGYSSHPPEKNNKPNDHDQSSEDVNGESNGLSTKKGLQPDEEDNEYPFDLIDAEPDLQLNSTNEEEQTLNKGPEQIYDPTAAVTERAAQLINILFDDTNQVETQQVGEIVIFKNTDYYRPQAAAEHRSGPLDMGVKQSMRGGPRIPRASRGFTKKREKMLPQIGYIGVGSKE